MARAKRRKKFFDVEIPLIQKQTQLQAYELNELNNRTLKYDLTRILRGKSMMLNALVKIEGEKAVAFPREIRIMPYFIKRITRKGTDFVEDSFSAKCKDAQLRIKPFLITRRKVSRAVRKALREKAKEEIINYVKDKTHEEIFDDLLKNRLQKPLSLILKRIYPLSFCEIRVLKIEKENKENKQ